MLSPRLGEKMQKFIRLALTAALSLTVSACFVSETALFDVDPDIRPIEPGWYMGYSVDEDGEIEDGDIWIGQVGYVDGFLSSQTENMPLQGATFYEIGPDSWIARNALEDGLYVYLTVFRYPDGRLFGHLPECDGLSSEERAALGLVFAEHGRCQVSSLATLEDAIQAYLGRNSGMIRNGAVLMPISPPEE